MNRLVLDNAFKRHSNYEEMRIGLNQEHKTLGALAVGAGAVLWGTIGPVISLFPDGVSFQYSAFRSAVGSLILWLIVGFSRNKTRYTREDKTDFDSRTRIGRIPSVFCHGF